MWNIREMNEYYLRSRMMVVDERETEGDREEDGAIV